MLVRVNEFCDDMITHVMDNGVFISTAMNQDGWGTVQTQLPSQLNVPSNLTFISWSVDLLKNLGVNVDDMSETHGNLKAIHAYGSVEWEQGDQIDIDDELGDEKIKVNVDIVVVSIRN